MRDTSIGISFIVFYKDTKLDLDSTLLTIANTCQAMKFNNFEIITVDDGSTPAYKFLGHLPGNPELKHITHKKSTGIASAIYSGLKIAKFAYSLPTPGHDMFSEKSFANIIKLVGMADLILACRTNLSSTRPLMKKFASRILRDWYRHLCYYYIGDIHGLFLVRSDDFLKYINPKMGHSAFILVITQIIKDGGQLIQTTAQVKDNHNRRPSKKLREAIPSVKSIIKVIISLRQARKIVRSRQRL